MAARRILVLTTAPGREQGVRERVLRDAGEDAEVLVVAPASDLSFLDWLTNAEDRAREEAEQTAARVADAVPAHVDARVGDVDPLTAAEDALRTFPADELVIVTRPEDEASWLEKDVPNILSERLGLPVKQVVDDAGDVETPARSGGDDENDGETLARSVAQGRSQWTGFVVESTVLLVIAVVAGLAIAAAVIVYVVFG